METGGYFSSGTTVGAEFLGSSDPPGCEGACLPLGGAAANLAASVPMEEISKFAPYAAHVFGVDLFFYLALRADLISKNRPSNKIDIAYLYYLPFCMVFVSNDRLHEKAAPLFLTADQVFIHGTELKVDLNRLDIHYSELPEEIREQGIMCFAQDPPSEGEYLTTKLWDRFLPKWRENLQGPRERSSEKDERILAYINKVTEGAKPLSDLQAEGLKEPDFIVLEHKFPAKMGKWRLLPPEIEKNQDSSSRD